MHITEKEYQVALDGYSYIDEAVRKFGEEYSNEFCGGSAWVNKIDFDPEDGTIEIEEEFSYCGCCSNDYETYYLPIDYLWDEHWIGREKERRAEVTRQKEKAEVERKAQYKKEQE